MFTPLLAAALLATPASAASASAELSLNAARTSDGLHTSHGASTMLGLGVGNERLFLLGEARSYAGNLWLGRATGGVDWLRSDSFELSTGLVLGTHGRWDGPLLHVSDGDRDLGFALGFGANLGPVHARYRRIEAIGATSSGRLSEDELRLGWEVGDTVEVFGQLTRFEPREARSAVDSREVDINPLDERNTPIHTAGVGLAVRL